MNHVAEVKLWSSTIGAVALEENADTGAFEYDPEFVRSGIQVAPLMMPLSSRVYRFDELSRRTFHGLPGLLADSLPDRFGNALINAWLAVQGRTPESFNAVERLLYTGVRGMGGLEFHPASGPAPTGPRAEKSTRIRVDKLVELASEILSYRDDLKASFADSDRNREASLRDILRVGTSAGGARAKAVIAWNPETNEVRSGQVNAGPGFEYWIMKFDGVSGNMDKELEDPQGYGAIEYAYSRMARDAGIAMSDCRLFEERGNRHFMTKRFDRLAGGDKLHMQSLCAMAHYDFNLPGAYSYEGVFSVMRRIGLDAAASEEMYRRMIFNIVARNQDDHTKNIAFLMDRSGRWSLAPAFDLTYAYNPHGAWTHSHQMTVASKRDGFTWDDLRKCADAASLKRGRARTILEEVQKTVSRWPDYADDAGVRVEHRDAIAKALRTAPFGPDS